MEQGYIQEREWSMGIEINKNILAIIPARGGSKSIPNKNIKKLGNKPLITYPIELAKSIKVINKIVVSTDSEEIAKVARQYGAEVPFIRPAELAKDETPTLPVLQHCVKFLEGNENYKADLILLLYPTCPFLKKETVIETINLLKDKNCNSVISVEKDYGRFWKYNKLKNKYIPFYPKKRINRQYYKPLLRENGAIYYSKYDMIMNENKIVDDNSIKFLVMNPKELIDLDTIEDWKNAEERIKNRK